MFRLFHGGMGSWTHWGRNIGAPCTQVYSIALDMPGYGNSANASGEDGSIHCVAEVFAEIIDEATPAGLVGFSFGVVIATSGLDAPAAAGGRAEPARARRMRLSGRAFDCIAKIAEG